MICDIITHYVSTAIDYNNNMPLRKLSLSETKPIARPVWQFPLVSQRENREAASRVIESRDFANIRKESPVRAGAGAALTELRFDADWKSALRRECRVHFPGHDPNNRAPEARV
jgi:hypothetical protein